MNTSKSEPSVTEPPTKSAVLNIWWDKGYVLEDEALAVINNWEKKVATQSKLSFYT